MENMEELASYIFNFYKNKTVLITGNTGFKGSWLSELLYLAGANVIGYSLESPTDPNLYSILKLDEKIKTIYGDIRDISKLLSAFQTYKPEIVIHLAAQPIVLDSYENPVYTYDVNVMGTVNVLECIRNCVSVKSFLNVTTDKVYENLDKKRHSFKENEKLDGFDPYSNSKSCSELVTHSYVRSFFKNGKYPAISTARAGNVIGGGDFSPHRIVVDAIMSAVSEKDLLVRNPYSTRPYQFVLEPLFIYLLICAKQFENKKYSGCYNVGPDKCDAISTGKLATMFCYKWGENMHWKTVAAENSPHEASFLSLNNRLLKKTFGWKPILHIDQAIDWTVEWAKEYQKNGDVTKVVDDQIKRFDYIFNKVIRK